MTNKLPPELLDNLVIDETSPSGLRWKSSGKGRRKDLQAGSFQRKYWAIMYNGIKYYNHRVIYFLKTGIDPGNFTIDHINRDTKDNRVVNIRLATKRQQLGNTKLSRKNKSGYRGVCWNKQSKRWNAFIRINKKSVFLGSFNSKERAACAYNDAALEYFGKFAYLNVIQHKENHQLEPHPNQPA
jgi:hypothetical protein